MAQRRGSFMIASGMMEPVLADNELAPVVQVHSARVYIYIYLNT